MKKCFLVFFLLLFVMSIYAYCEKFSFLVFGDNHGDGSVFRDIIKKMGSEYDIDFAICVGDMTLRGTNAEFSRFWEMTDELNYKVYACMGNHDIPGVSLFKKKYGNNYYYFDHKGCRFIILDNSRSKGMGSVQMQWLKKAFKTGDKIFIFLHKPPIDMTEMHPRYIMTPSSEVSELQKLLVSNKVKYVFSGHIHGYGRTKENGIVYIITAGAGAPLYLPHFNGGYYNYVRVTVDGDEINDEVVPLYND